MKNNKNAWRPKIQMEGHHLQDEKVMVHLWQQHPHLFHAFGISIKEKGDFSLVFTAHCLN